jgi:hypothetical protein
MDPTNGGKRMKITETQITNLAERVAKQVFRELISTTDINGDVAIHVAVAAGNAAGNRLTLELLESGVTIERCVPQPYVGQGPHYNVTSEG